jgi:hypothetical protein
MVTSRVEMGCCSMPQPLATMYSNKGRPTDGFLQKHATADNGGPTVEPCGTPRRVEEAGPEVTSSSPGKLLSAYAANAF